MIHYVHPSLSTPVGYWPVRIKEGMKEEEQEWVCTVSEIFFISTLSDDRYFLFCTGSKEGKKGQGRTRNRKE